MACKAKNKQGGQCGSRPVTGTDFCYFHNPSISQREKKKVRSRGGINNRTLVDHPFAPVLIRKPRDIQTLLNRTINEVRAGEMDIRVANCIGYLSGQMIKAFEVTELEERIEKLEELASQPTYHPTP